MYSFVHCYSYALPLIDLSLFHEFSGQDSILNHAQTFLQWDFKKAES